MKNTFSFLFLFAFSIFPALSQKAGKENYNYQRGVEAYEADNYQEAGKYLTEALSEDEENGYALTYLGSVYRQLGYNGAALTFYKQAMEYVPAKDKEFIAQIHAERADTYWAMQDTLRALSEQEQAVRLMPKKGEYLRARGYIKDCLKNYEQAEADYKEALALDTADTYTRYYLAGNAASQKKWQEAINWGDETLRRDSDCVHLYIVRTEAYFRLHNIKESATELAKAWHFCGFQNEVTQWTDTLAQTDYAATVQAIEAAQTLWRDDSDLCFALSHAARSTRRYATALNQLHKYVAAKDDNADRYFSGLIYGDMYSFEEAVQELRLAYEADSSEVNITLAYADYLADAGHLQESLNYYNKVVAENPLYPYAYGARCRSYRLMGNYEAALDDALHYVALDPDESYAQMSVARCLLHLNRTQEARPYLEEAASLDSVALRSSQRMFALFYLGRTAEAEEWTNRVLQEEEKRMEKGQMEQIDEQSYVCAARFYALKGDKAETLKYLRMAFEYNYRDFNYLRKCEEFASLQGDNDFEALIKEYTQKPPTWK